MISLYMDTEDHIYANLHVFYDSKQHHFIGVRIESKGDSNHPTFGHYAT